MHHLASNRLLRVTLLALASLAAHLLLGACSSSNHSNTTPVSAQDFASSPAPVAPSSAPVQAAPSSANIASLPPPVAKPGPTLTGPLAVSDGIVDVQAQPGTPPSTTAAAVPSHADDSELIFINAIVGQANGKPIVVSEFLDPLGPRLRALAREKGRSRDSWRQEAAQSISVKLRDVIGNEVLRAESISTLTPEMKQGLFSWIDRQQQKFQSENLGSREVADRRLASEGKTLDQWKEDKEEETLIGFLLREKVYSRIQVTKRESQLFYEQNYKKFNPDPKIYFRRISLPSRNRDAVAEITNRLAARIDFKQLAQSDLNMYKRKDGGLDERDFAGEQAESDFYNNKALNAAAQTLQPGSFAGPFEVGSDTEWLYLDRIKRRSITWYDAQVEIENEIRGRRLTEGRNKYIDRLIARGSYTSIDEMTNRLLVIAEDRFYPKSQQVPR